VPSTTTSAHLPDALDGTGAERTSDVHHPEILGDAGTVRQHVRHEREVRGHVDAVTQTSCLSSGAALVGITAAVVLFGLQLL